MPAIAQLASLLSPNSVVIMAQQATGFSAFLITRLGIPGANRVRLDLTETEDHIRSYRIPRNPVEMLTAQNKIRMPDVFTCTGMLSANPLVSPLAKAGLARLDKRELHKLRGLVDRPTPLFVVTPEHSLSDMVLVNLREHYDDKTGNGVKLTLTFQEIQIASPLLVDGALDLDGLALGAGAMSDMGAQTPSAVPDPVGFAPNDLRLG